MKQSLLIFASALVFPLCANAATFSLVAEAQHEFYEIEVGNRLEIVRDTETDGPSAQITIHREYADNEASAEAIYDHSDMSFSLTSSATNAPGGDGSKHFARSRLEATSQYGVSGDGTLRLDLGVTGLFGGLTDRNDGRALSHILAGFSVELSDGTIYRRLSSFDPLNDLSNAMGISIFEELTETIALKDGDTFSLSMFALADAGDFPNNTIPRDYETSFFAAHSEISGGLMLTTEGIGLDEISPVPLPAGLPLLLGGLGGLALLRRKGQQRAARV